MNSLTEITGFVQFKSAFLINGQPGAFYIKPWDNFNRNVEGGSRFTDPRDYTENAIFLGIELGDAGNVLEEHQIENMAQVWDIFLGTVMALAKGELACSFEHRDLHENNICINRTCGPCEHFNPESTLRCGFSGLEVTLIDYGLSRATLQNGETMFYDLEDDLEVFQGSDGHPQFNAYRKMRTHLFTNTRTMEKKSWHDDSSRDHSNGHSWDEYKPYTNVIWLHFLLGYLKKNLYQIPCSTFGTLKDFNAETKELSKRMDTRTKVENGAFLSATEVLEFCIGQGWISYEQAEVSGVFDDLEDDELSVNEENPKKSAKGKEKQVDIARLKKTSSKKGD
ncbi:putative serine/threonine-protein kinase haspin like protein [Amylocarpus encephaloides]|uniref:non-specific serine/threonine protein kinase n=1 Tax=Amylocarpus encephaloides TaxID=45428 RepID=A0A9P8C0Z1_9HELO|nr:putative serine/threonine-protein kinase haspin like protein [Amylocarpus encephaloides]